MAAWLLLYSVGQMEAQGRAEGHRWRRGVLEDHHRVRRSFLRRVSSLHSTAVGPVSPVEALVKLEVLPELLGYD